MALARPTHIPVLPDTILSLLSPSPGETYVDCTAGLGGHASLIGPHLAPRGRVVLGDLDRENLERAASAARTAARDIEVEAIHGNFAALPRRLEREGIRADLALADLGFASNQVDDPSRGLSFRRDGPLDMRLDSSGPMTAADLIATAPEAELARILREFGDEAAARPLARKLVAVRKERTISTTGQLAEIVRGIVRFGGGIDPATRTFQALRIAVNDELGSLEGLLGGVSRAARRGSAGWLNAGARVGIVSFHSLEDRMVKRCFAKLISAGLAEPIGAQPTTASGGEIDANPRSRSAKLRVIRLVPGDG